MRGGGGVISILKSVILKNCVILDDFDEIRQLGLFDTVLHETKESGKKKCCSAPRIEILSVHDYLD